MAHGKSQAGRGREYSRGVWFAGVGALLLPAALRAEAPPLEDTYRQAAAYYRAGDCEKALPLFVNVQTQRPSYKETDFYIDRCAALLKDRGDALRAGRAAQRAQDILSARESLLSRIRADPAAVNVQDGETQIRFRLNPATLFPPGDSAFSPSAESLLTLLKDYLATYRNPYLIVTCEKAAASSQSEVERNVRRAVSLGLYFFRQSGLGWENISIQSRPADADALILAVERTGRPAQPSGQKVQGVMVSPRSRVLDVDKGQSLVMDVALLDPQRIREWTLKILNAEGLAVKEFSGTSDLGVTLIWDGRDEAGQPARPGEYQVFLSAQNQANERHSDSTVFVVRSAGPVPAPPAAAAKPRDQRRKWSHVIRFADNDSRISGLNRLDIKQLAANIKAFPGEKVCIDGFADTKERNAQGLAVDRARSVAEVLQDLYDVPLERLQVRGKDPRPSMDGETLQKAVIFFTEQ